MRQFFTAYVAVVTHKLKLEIRKNFKMIELIGNWNKGYAYDLHTLSSTYLGVDASGHDRWENNRSEMGELVYKLKYNGDQRALSKIVDLLSVFKDKIKQMDYIVPIPSSNTSRQVQPVHSIANEVGRRANVAVLKGLLHKSSTTELKNVDDPEQRKSLLEASMSLSKCFDIKGKNILLLDDLFRSGATLEVATELLYTQGDVKKVNVITMTKTRSKR